MSEHLAGNLTCYICEERATHPITECYFCGQQYCSPCFVAAGRNNCFICRAPMLSFDDPTVQMHYLHKVEGGRPATCECDVCDRVRENKAAQQEDDADNMDWVVNHMPLQRGACERYVQPAVL